MRLTRFSLFATCALVAACGEQPAGNDGDAPPGAAAAEAAPAATGAEALVYPGSQGTRDGFSTADPIDRVVAWYWEADEPVRERGDHTWAVSKPERRDEGYLVHLTVVSDEEGSSYAIYLNPRSGGGTDGRIRFITPEEVRSGVQL